MNEPQNHSHYTRRSEDASVELLIEVTENKIINLHFKGDPSDRDIFELYSSLCVGCSLREAAEHSGIFTLAEWRTLNPRPSSSGIDTVDFISPGMRTAQDLLRQVCVQHYTTEELAQWNFDDRGLSQGWCELSEESKVNKIKAIQSTFLTGRGLTTNSLKLVTIDKYDRLFYEIHEQVPVQMKPELLLSLEISLQRKTGERLEVFLSEMKDKNKIRRL